MDGMDGMDRMTKMTNAAAALLSGEPDMNGGTAARDATLPAARSPLPSRPLAPATAPPPESSSPSC